MFSIGVTDNMTKSNLGKERVIELTHPDYSQSGQELTWEREKESQRKAANWLTLHDEFLMHPRSYALSELSLPPQPSIKKMPLKDLLTSHSFSQLKLPLPR